MSLYVELYDYVAHLRLRTRSRETLRGYVRDLSDFLRALDDLNVRDLRDIRAEHVERHLQVRSRPPTQDAPATLRRRAASIRGLLAYWRRRGLLPENVGLEVTLPRLPRRLPRAIPKREIEQLLDAVTGETFIETRDRAVLEVLYSTGCRVQEVLGIELQDLSDSGAVRVIGKGDRERTCFLHRRAQDAIARWLLHREALLRERGIESELLFVTESGKPGGHKVVYLAVQRAVRAAGTARHVHPHAFRHSFATHLLEGGATTRDVQELLGHASLETTQVYLAVTGDRLRDAFTSSHPLAGRSGAGP